MPVTFTHQILLAASVAALAGAGLRLATVTGALGLTRVVTAVVFGATIAVLEALGLGLVGLGGSPVALAVAAGCTWVAARLRLPNLVTAPRDELVSWWGETPAPVRVGFAAIVGVWLLWAVWLARYPILGADSMIYHVPEVIEWVHNGRPGSISSLFPGYPVGAYPVTNEVLLAWTSGISRSFAPVMLWPALTLALLATAGWVGLRSLRIPRVAAGLAVTTLCLTPALTHWQKNGAHTDLPALAWLVCAGALCAASVGRPALFSAVVLACGLAVGTKTTTLPLAALVLGLGVAVHRRDLGAHRRVLALATVAAVGVGGVWYLRNLVLHGSPFWPFVASPWGDPVPEVIAPSGEVVEQVYTRFLDTPVQTLDFILGNWARPFAGGLALIAAALLTPLVVRSRAVIGATVVTALSLVLWMNAPFTGISESDAGSGALTTMRYLLPTFTAAALTLCLAARDRGYARAYAIAALVLALGLTAWQLFDLGYPSAPRPAAVLLGAALAAAIAGLAQLLPAQGVDWSRVVRLAPVPAVVLVGLALSVAASGFVERYNAANLSESRKFFSASPAMFDWFLKRPEYLNGDRPIAFTVVMNAALAGDRLQHRIDLVSALEGCAKVQDRLRSGCPGEAAGARADGLLADARADDPGEVDDDLPGLLGTVGQGDRHPDCTRGVS